jgi:predicted RNA polymerase sigma factor
MVANWLHGVARQTALQARRIAVRRRARERQVSEMPEPASAEQDLWRDLQPLLDEALGRLPDKYRAVIVPCDLEGKTRKEVARQLGVPEGTVAGWLARARAMLAARGSAPPFPVCRPGAGQLGTKDGVPIAPPGDHRQLWPRGRKLFSGVRSLGTSANRIGPYGA